MKRSIMVGVAAWVVLATLTLASGSSGGVAAQNAYFIFLSPAAATNPVGTSHTVTASVSDASALGNPLGGAPVTLTVLPGSPNAGPAGSGLTNANGQVAFTYTSNGTSGIDTIQACFPDPTNTSVSICSVPVMKGWGVSPPPPPPLNSPVVLLMAPATATNPAGTSHAVTVTVTTGLPVGPGFGIFFIVATGPNAGPAGFGQTGANGQVSMTYTSNGTPGTDVIEACYFSSCTSASKDWLVPATSTLPPAQAPVATTTAPASTQTSPPTSTATAPASTNDGDSGFAWWALAIAAGIGAVGGLGIVLLYRRRRTAIIWFAGITDSTARLGDAAFREKARALDEALRRAIASNGGTAIEGELLGDGVLAVFGAPREAIACAQACQAAAEGVDLELHVGVHAGEVSREEGNVYGGAAKIASRLAGEAGAGETLVSGTVRDLAGPSAGASFEDRGERELKGVSEPVRLWAVRPHRTP